MKTKTIGKAAKFWYFWIGLSLMVGLALAAFAEVVTGSPIASFVAGVIGALAIVTWRTAYQKDFATMAGLKKEWRRAGWGMLFFGALLVSLAVTGLFSSPDSVPPAMPISAAIFALIFGWLYGMAGFLVLALNPRADTFQSTKM